MQKNEKKGTKESINNRKKKEYKIIEMDREGENERNKKEKQLEKERQKERR